MAALKLVYKNQAWPIDNARIRIGRAKGLELQLEDGLVSSNHAVISNGFLYDIGSTNGTEINGRKLQKNVKVKLRENDRIQVGDCILRIERGGVVSKEKEELNRSKRFGGALVKEPAKPESKESRDVADKESKMTVPELMEAEFKQIIGHDQIKTQLRQFYKKIQLDRIRASQGVSRDKKRLYHMMFLGPPGTGKTTMANLVAKMMLKMKLVQSDKVVFVNNALELLAGYSGQTPAKVDAKVAEAKGGVLFIDEAYSIVKDEASKDTFGKEAIDTLMKHLDPPSCVFIFAGYEKQMDQFLKVNPGLARRIPYRYTFQAYTTEQLCQIFKVMCESKGESLEDGVLQALPELLDQISDEQKETQNAGLVNNWVSFAQIERDDRIDIDEAERNPAIASLLCKCDLENTVDKVKQMS